MRLEISDEEVSAFLACLALGALHAYRAGIPGGGGALVTLAASGIWRRPRAEGRVSEELALILSLLNEVEVLRDIVSEERFSARFREWTDLLEAELRRGNPERVWGVRWLPDAEYSPWDLADLLNRPGPLWLAGASLAGAYLRGAPLRGANLERADLAGAVLGGADLAGANLAGANLSGADLNRADLRGATLSFARLRWAALRDANLEGALLNGAFLRGADLTGADLTGAWLERARLEGANLNGAILRDAVLTGAHVDEGQPQGAGAEDPAEPRDPDGSGETAE